MGGNADQNRIQDKRKFIGPLLFFILGWDIWFLFGQQWTQCLILTGMAVACFLVIFAAAVVIVLLEMVREGIGGFIRS